MLSLHAYPAITKSMNYSGCDPNLKNRASIHLRSILAIMLRNLDFISAHSRPPFSSLPLLSPSSSPPPPPNPRTTSKTTAVKQKKN